MNQSFAVTCSNLLAPSTSDLPADATLVTKNDFAESAKLLEALEAEDLELMQVSKEINRLDKVLLENKRLRRKTGGYTNPLQGSRIQAVIKLKSALRDQKLERVWQAVNHEMILTEYHAIKLNSVRKRIAVLEKQQAALGEMFFFSFFKRQEINTKLMNAKFHAARHHKKLQMYYRAYRASRAVFEDMMAHGSSKREKDFAAKAFSTVGISNSGLAAKIPSTIDLPEDGRPSMEFIQNEYTGVDFPDGSPRYLGNESLIGKIELENQALRDNRIKKGLVFEFLLMATGLVSEFLHKSPVNSKVKDWFAKFLDRTRKDHQNREAIRTHLAEINSIQAVPASRRMGHFQKVLANFYNNGFINGTGFDFLTNFFRAHEYKQVRNRIFWTIALRNLDTELSLIDQYFTAERKLDVKKIELDLNIQEIEEAAGDQSKISTLEVAQEALLIEIGILENRLFTVSSFIDAAILKFQELEPLKNGSKPGLFADQALFKDMVAASEQAYNMKALSYEYSPGTPYLLKTASFAIITYSLGAIFINTPAMDLLNAWFIGMGYENGVPDFQQMWDISLEKISSSPRNLN